LWNKEEERGFLARQAGLGLLVFGMKKLLVLVVVAWGGAGLSLADCGPWQVVERYDGRQGDLPKGVACVESLSLEGAAVVSCFWRFAYRSDAARAGFERAAGALEACYPGLVAETPGPSVNHPDSFEQLQYHAGARRFSVGLKDKAALGASMVILSIADQNATREP